MANETIKKVAELLKDFNDSFELKALILENDGEDASVSLSIDKLKNNGTEFINAMYETFNVIVQLASKDHEVIYIEGKGLIVAKKITKQVVKTEFVPEDFD